MATEAKITVPPPEPQQQQQQKSTSKVIVDKSLATAANLIKLLPTCTVMTFEALYPSFSNRGQCLESNKYLTGALVAFCSISCVFFSFTDSLVGHDGKHYFGVATFKGFYLFNHDGTQEEREKACNDASKFKLKGIDITHAFLSVLVFLTVALSQSDVVRCFFPDAKENGRQWLKNVPLGVGFVSGLFFILFPTTRKGIGYSDAAP